MLLCLGVFLGIYWSLIPWRSFFKKLNLRELISSKPLQNWEKNKKRKWFRYFTYFTLSVDALPVFYETLQLHRIISVTEMNIVGQFLIKCLTWGYINASWMSKKLKKQKKKILETMNGSNEYFSNETSDCPFLLTPIESIFWQIEVYV